MKAISTSKIIKIKCDEVKSDIKIHPGTAGRRLTAFVSRKLSSLRIVRPEQLTDQQIDADKAEP